MLPGIDQVTITYSHTWQTTKLLHLVQYRYLNASAYSLRFYECAGIQRPENFNMMQDGRKCIWLKSLNKYV